MLYWVVGDSDSPVFVRWLVGARVRLLRDRPGKKIGGCEIGIPEEKVGIIRDLFLFCLDGSFESAGPVSGQAA